MIAGLPDSHADPDRFREIVQDAVPLARRFGDEPSVVIGLSGIGRLAAPRETLDRRPILLRVQSLNGNRTRNTGPIFREAWGGPSITLPKKSPGSGRLSIAP